MGITEALIAAVVALGVLAVALIHKATKVVIEAIKNYEELEDDGGIQQRDEKGRFI